MCTFSAAKVKSAGATLGKALNDIANIVARTNTALAEKIRQAAASLVNVTSKWTDGSPKALFDDAAAVVEEVLAQIPQTAPYAIFVSIAVTALDLLIANIGTPPASISVEAVHGTMARISALPPNPWRGKAEIHHHTGHSLESDVTQAWNDAVKKNPGLGIKAIK